MQTDNRTSEKDRKVSARSAAYPFITIEKALGFVITLKGTFQSSLFNREDITQVLKKSDFKRDVSAAVQYGLLEKSQGEGYKISQTALQIITPVLDEERADNIIDCFMKPKLYSELMERFKGQPLPPDDRLQAILIRFHNITQAAAPQAVEVFIQNAYFAGLLNKQRVLSSTVSNTSNVVTTVTDIAPVINQENIVDSVDKIKAIQADETNSSNTIAPNPKTRKEDLPQTLSLEDINGKIEVIIRLTEKKVARLVYPESINDKDIQILKLQLEQLALTL